MLRRSAPYALLLALIGALLAASPLRQPGYYGGHDGIAHAFRVAVLATEIAQGNWYPRWAPDLALGYGYPVFHFYGPVSHYVAWIVSGAGFSFPDSVKVVYLLTLVACSLGMVAFTRAAFPNAGWWAAGSAGAAFALAPYLLDDIYVRGAFGEAVSFAWYPLMLLGVFHLTGERRRFGFLLSAATIAGAVVTYNPIALFGLPLALAYGLVRSPRSIGWLSTTFLTGLAGSAWFWLPAIVDSSAVTIGNLGYARENFLEPSAIVQMSLFHRHELFPFTLGLVQVLMALVGTVAIIRLVPEERRDAAFFAVAGLVIVVAVSTPLASLWDVIPLIKLIAYPWRLFGLVALCWAVPTCVLIAAVPRRGQALAAIGLVGLLATTSVTETLPTPDAIDPVAFTSAGWLRREAQLGIVGTTTGAEYLPRWSAEGPGAANNTSRDEFAGRIQSAALEGADGLSVAVRLNAPQPLTLRRHQFAFPGWYGEVNGNRVDAVPDTPLGLMSIPVPAGESRVAFRFGPTPQALAGAGLSITALAILGVVAAWPLRRRLTHSVVALVIAGVPGTSTAPPARVVPVGQEMAQSIWLLGARVQEHRDVLSVRFYWLATRPPQSNLPVTLELRDPNNSVLAQRTSSVRYGTEWTDEWRATEIIDDPVWWNVGTQIPAGANLSATIGGQRVELGTVNAVGRSTTLAASEVSFSQQIGLQDSSVVVLKKGLYGGLAGAEVEISLTWRSLVVPAEDYVAFVHLYGQDDKRWVHDDRIPGANITSFAALDPGMTTVDRRRYVIPLDLPPGEYRFEIGLYVPGEGTRLNVDGSQASTYVVARLSESGDVRPASR